MPWLRRLFFLLASAPLCLGYASITHQELIDLAWNDSIRPLLLARYPGTTEAGLRRAHAYAYGGCLIQDVGYYPFGKKLFSDLAHYVRSGDFVSSLMRNARDVDELAFAIGALSHYVGDSFGHGLAVNPSTAITFPDLEKKYGPIVTYEDAPTAHVRTEFGFDVAQIARRHYAPRAYREYIGFRVARPVLDRAYMETYGLKVRNVLGRPQRAAFATYRTAVRWMIPLFARATIVEVRRNLPPEATGPENNRLLAELSRTDHAQKWSAFHHGPGVQAYILWFLMHLVPKVGTLKILAVRAPTPETEELFVRSLNESLARLRELMANFANNPRFTLADRDLDTGARVRPGAYGMTDRTYEKLLHVVTKDPERPVPAGLRDDILAYYANPDAPISTKRNRKAWDRVQKELEILRGLRAAD